MTDQIISEEKQPEEETRRRGLGKAGIFFLTLIMVIFVAFGYGYFQLSKVNIALASTSSALLERSVGFEKAINALQNSVAQLQQAAQKSQDLSAQQEKLMSEWQAAQKGDLNKWHIAEAQYLVKLANDHLQFTHNTSLALALLQRADQVLQNIQDPAVLEIRKSLASDIANLQAAPDVDVNSLYVRVVGLDNQVDKLPLPVNPLGTNENTSKNNPDYSSLSWWKAGLARTRDALRKIVVVRYNGDNALPLVLPDEKAFLYQNLHAQMENIMWALLHHNQEIYQASLDRASDWVKEYFVQDAAETKAMLQNLADLRNTTIQTQTKNLSATLQLFEVSLSQAGQTPPAQ